jgi:peptidoglycan/xylan/chitin deacetylase (PgdA/CDA1 family)
VRTRRRLGGALLCAALLTGAAAPGGHAAALRERAAPVPILTYHGIGRPPAGARHPRLWVGATRFRRQIAALARAGFRAVTPAQLWAAWHDEVRLPSHPVVVSFDDGYTGQYRHALPVLRARGWPGALNLWVGRLDAPGGLTREQVRQMLAAGWELDAHSLTHPDLTTLGPERLRDEVAGSRTALQQAFGAPIDFFCYPYGRFDAAVEAAVRAAGYVAATTTRRALAGPAADPYELPRVGIDARTAPSALVRELRRLRRRAGAQPSSPSRR